MGISAQRLHRQKLAAAQGRAAGPAVPRLPMLIPREEHLRALQELKKSLGRAGLSGEERAELEQLRKWLVEAKAEWQPMLDELERVRSEVERLTTEIEQAQAHILDLEESNAKLAGAGGREIEGAEGGTAGGEQPPAGEQPAASADAPGEAPAPEASTPASSEAPKSGGEEPKGKGGKGSRK